MDYTIEQKTLRDLANYQNIPMLKKFSSLVRFDDEQKMIETSTNEQVIDLAKEESIEEWKTLFSKKSTGLFVITKNSEWIAGVIIVTHAPKIHMLQNDMTNAVLWDIRVHPEHQGYGLGKKLFNLACSYAIEQNCQNLLIETQNNNPNAIKFYQHMGAVLYQENHHAYKNQPDEIQYIFKKRLI